MTDSATIQLACDLISRSSVTPDHSDAQELMISRLEALGFNIERMQFGDVPNFWARLGDQAPLVAFAGHTDVVPPGPDSAWHSPPFEPTIRDGRLYGRGAADMKGSLAAMITACESFLADTQKPAGSIGFLITGDEEGPSVDGTVKVVEALQARGEHIDMCLVGEPSSTDKVGDVIKNGRRGSLGAVMTVTGVQGHVAYPHLADNPVHRALAALDALCQEVWDEGNDHFPATSFQISNINAGTGATNVIPGELVIVFNFRFSTEWTADGLQKRTHEILDRFDMQYNIDWTLSGNPFLTAEGELVDAMQAAVEAVAGYRPALSTAGGTSDGRFIAPTGSQVAELGPVNESIHKLNEWVDVTELDQLSDIYADMLGRLLKP